MGLDIGGNIKRLRGERGLTQEKLAVHLGVTTRAVSKWECGKAYPDITLLPGLAGFFGVTIDELMQTDAIRSKERADGLRAQAMQNQSQGKIEENIMLLRETIKDYPGDYWFQMMLANSLLLFKAYLRGLPEEPEILKVNYREAAGIYEHVLKHCADDALRLSARIQAFYAYQFLGQTDKAKEMYDKLPLFEQCSLLVIPDYLSPGDRTAAIQAAIKKLTGGFRAALLLLADAGNKSYGLERSNADRIRIFEKANRIYELVYEDGDYGLAASSLHANYATMARLASMDGDLENTLIYLEKAVDYAVMYDTRVETLDENGMAVVTHSSLLADHSPDLELTNTRLTEHNACWNFLNLSLPHEAFSGLVALAGHTDRYKAAVARLEQHENAEPSLSVLSYLESLKEKAVKGDVRAASSLGTAYATGQGGAPVDDAEAFKWYQLAAEKGDTGACNNVGEAYMLGRGVRQDYTEALRWFRQSDEVPNPFGKGNPWARDNIGTMYRDGLGVTQSYSEALKWYRLAADLLFPIAHYHLGEMYEKGLGVAQDYVKAARYYEKAANPDPVFNGYILPGDFSPDTAKQALERVKAYIIS